MDPADHVEQTAAPPGSSLYYSMLELSTGQRATIAALFALRDEALKIVRDVSEPQVRTVKTSWWQEELQRIHDAQGQHPITQVLARYHDEFAVDGSTLSPVFEAVKRFDSGLGFESEKQLIEWCEAISGTITQAVAAVLSHDDPRLGRYGQLLGTAFQLTLHVSEMASDLERQLLFVPQQELRQYGVEAEALLAHRHDDRIGRLMALQTKRAMDYHSRALEALPPECRYGQQMGIILYNIDTALLDEIGKDQYRVTQQQIALTPLRKLWITWRTRRRERRREKQRLKHAK